MKNLFKIAGASVLAAGMLFAQSVTDQTAPPANGAQPQHRHVRARMGQRMAKYLNLTPDQQANAKQVYAQARQESQPVRQQLKQDRQQMRAAVKAGDTAQINSLATAEGPLLAKLAAIRSTAFSKIYSTLTPDQKAKADNMHAFFMQRFHQRQAQKAS
ncbi:MAG TPA: Spy/CpxP family protein refolding chaperone [Bryobacteraceae bacterium]|nr:Spy/CpxP family protein refolding chaperone [Bryobacteraceae bacterium]